MKTKYFLRCPSLKGSERAICVDVKDSVCLVTVSCRTGLGFLVPQSVNEGVTYGTPTSLNFGKGTVLVRNINTGTAYLPNVKGLSSQDPMSLHTVPREGTGKILLVLSGKGVPVCKVREVSGHGGNTFPIPTLSVSLSIFYSDTVRVIYSLLFYGYRKDLRTH